jgi:hypothetical protein
MRPEDLSDEIKIKIAEFFLENSVPHVLVLKSVDDNRSVSSEYAAKKSRKVRGAKALSNYLESIDCPMGEGTIYNLMRSQNIPFHRPAPQYLIFDLDEIDTWLGTDYQNR